MKNENKNSKLKDYILIYSKLLFGNASIRTGRVPGFIAFRLRLLIVEWRSLLLDYS